MYQSTTLPITGPTPGKYTLTGGSDYWCRPIIGVGSFFVEKEPTPTILFLPVVRGAVVSVVVVWSGVDVLTNFLPVVLAAVVCVVTILYEVAVLSMA